MRQKPSSVHCQTDTAISGTADCCQPTQKHAERTSQRDVSISTMPEFERNPYGWQDYHDEQLRHYGLKRETAVASSTSSQVSPRSNYRRNEATGMPVPAAMPRRKPVPGASPPGTPPSQVRAPVPASPRTQSPEGTRLIYTRADGRFDPSTIRMDRSKYTPPSSPVNSYSRPSSSSSSQAPLKRTDSSDSKSSWKLRKQSAGETVRRLSNSVKEKAAIVAMDRNERVRFVRDKHSASGTPGTPTKVRTGRSGSVTKGEQLVLKMSKRADPIKALARRGTNDSDMSMGMTDTAPAGVMEPCIRCKRPIFDFATQGLCQQCYNDMKKKTGK